MRTVKVSFSLKVFIGSVNSRVRLGHMTVSVNGGFEGSDMSAVSQRARRGSRLVCF